MAHDTKRPKNAGSPPPDPRDAQDGDPLEPDPLEEIDESEFADFIEQEISGGSPTPVPVEDGPASEEVERLRKERDEAIAARQRAQADFVNFQRRSRGNETRAGRDGMIQVIRSLMPVIDNVDLALAQDPSSATVEQMVDGVRILRDELMKALQGNLVTSIRPEPGDDFDPKRHHAVMRLPTSELPENAIVNVLQVGFAIEDEVLRPATVVVAGPPESTADDATDAPGAPAGDEPTEG